MKIYNEKEKKWYQLGLWIHNDDGTFEEKKEQFTKIKHNGKEFKINLKVD